MQDQVVNQTEYRFESSVFVSFTTWLYITPPPKKKKKKNTLIVSSNEIKVEYNFFLLPKRSWWVSETKYALSILEHTFNCLAASEKMTSYK
jgi:hypothetical protein